MHDIFNYSLKATKIVVELITHANLIFFLSKHIAHEWLSLLASGLNALYLLLSVLFLLQNIGNKCLDWFLDSLKTFLQMDEDLFFFVMVDKLYIYLFITLN